jgi:hypothetical protein
VPTRLDVPAVLARHAIPPDADAPTLLAELERRGWAVRLEEPPTGGGRGRQAARHRALAFRARRAGAASAYRPHDHLQATGRTPAAALAGVLARVLEREG